MPPIIDLVEERVEFFKSMKTSGNLIVAWKPRNDALTKKRRGAGAAGRGAVDLTAARPLLTAPSDRDTAAVRRAGRAPAPGLGTTPVAYKRGGASRRGGARLLLKPQGRR